MVKGKLFGSSSDKANKPKKGRNYREISWYQCQCSGSSQIPSQDDVNYHQFLSLYNITKYYQAELHVYNTENETEEVKILDSELILDENTAITQLPNGELFCYGNRYSGVAIIIDRSYGVRMLPSDNSCNIAQALYFDNNIYCFGGFENYPRMICLTRKFDLKNKRWIHLASLPKEDYHCHSVIINGNILVSGHRNKNLLLYSIEIDSFSIIPYEFVGYKRKFLINMERLYLIEWDDEGVIYESEDEYHWEPISKLGKIFRKYDQIYCLYNKEKIYIVSGYNYYQFDLKKKVLIQIKS